MNLLRIVLAMTFCAATLPGCTKYKMTVPDGFRQYQDSGEFKMITADGVMLKGREVDNYPKADLPFWTDALKRHMRERGYEFKSVDCFKTKSGLDGCALEFMLPNAGEDWVLSECMFVIDDRIILLESAGPYARYAKVEKSLHEAYRTFIPNP